MTSSNELSCCYIMKEESSLLMEHFIIYIQLMSGEIIRCAVKKTCSIEHIIEHLSDHLHHSPHELHLFNHLENQEPIPDSILLSHEYEHLYLVINLCIKCSIYRKYCIVSYNMNWGIDLTSMRYDDMNDIVYTLETDDSINHLRVNISHIYLDISHPNLEDIIEYLPISKLRHLEMIQIFKKDPSHPCYMNYNIFYMLREKCTEHYFNMRAQQIIIDFQGFDSPI